MKDSKLFPLFGALIGIALLAGMLTYTYQHTAHIPKSELKKVKLEITGMTCESCAYKIKKATTAESDIHFAEINVEKGVGTFYVEETAGKAEKLIQIVEGLEYQAKEKEKNKLQVKSFNIQYNPKY